MNKLQQLVKINLVLASLIMMTKCEDNKANQDNEVSISFRVIQNSSEVTTVANNVEEELVFEVIEMNPNNGHGDHVSGLSHHAEIGLHETAGWEV